MRRDLEEKTIEVKEIFKGKVLDVEMHTVSLPDGGTSTRELVNHRGAVAVLAITKENEVILVEQYRKAIEQVTLEIPAGKLEPGEDNKKLSAIRELKEETGYEAKYGVSFDISFSEQKPSTDTIAVNLDNTPFRNEDGSLLFRPAGHGALIENLNDLDADVVFIKNIDNVVPDRLKDETISWKMIIAGKLVELQERAFAYLHKLEQSNCSRSELEEMADFLQKELSCEKHDRSSLDDATLAEYLYKKLNRPMRVCGMVKNVGEPGGGPFLVYNHDGTVSLQILESSQIDKNDETSMKMFTEGTHFNPVDLVCAIKDYKGNAFDLTKYVDKSTGFISSKSKNGRELKALELPGLWNGSMSDWNTVFVEVPLGTFNPVKTVNDLLREQHQ